MKLPETTVERLSLYKRVLLDYRFMDKPFIFSHDLARLLRIKPVQVRKDIMLLGFTGSTNNGYDVKKLIAKIDKQLGFREKQKIALVGLATIGGAIEEYIQTETKGFDIYASFLIHPETRLIKMEYPFFSIEQMPGIIEREQIKMAILAMPPEYAQPICDTLVASGVKAILNLCSTLLNVPDDVVVQNIDLITCVEKLVYFASVSNKANK